MGFVSAKIKLACFDTMCAIIATQSRKNAQFRLNLLSARAHARANIRAHARIYPLAEMNTDAPIIISLVNIFLEKIKKSKNKISMRVPLVLMLKFFSIFSFSDFLFSIFIVDQYSVFA